MRRLIPLALLAATLSSCGSSNESAIKNSSYYEAVQEVWDSLSTSNKSEVCSFLDGKNDEGAYSLIKIGLKFDLNINIDENAAKYDQAIKLFVKEKC